MRKCKPSTDGLVIIKPTFKYLPVPIQNRRRPWFSRFPIGHQLTLEKSCIKDGEFLELDDCRSLAAKINLQLSYNIQARALGRNYKNGQKHILKYF